MGGDECSGRGKVGARPPSAPVRAPSGALTQLSAIWLFRRIGLPSAIGSSDGGRNRMSPARGSSVVVSVVTPLQLGQVEFGARATGDSPVSGGLADGDGPGIFWSGGPEPILPPVMLNVPGATAVAPFGFLT